MLFPYGWPKRLEVSQDAGDPIVDFVFSSNKTWLIVLTASSLQIWNGTKHRVKLGQLQRDDANVKMHGLNSRCFVQNTRGHILVLTSENWLLFYSVKQGDPLKYGDELQGCGGGGVAVLHFVSLNPVYSSRLSAPGSGGPVCTCACVSEEVVLVGLSTGGVMQVSWQGKVEAQANPCASVQAAFAPRGGLGGVPPSVTTQVDIANGNDPATSAPGGQAVVQITYSPALEVVCMLLASGHVALLRPASRLMSAPPCPSPSSSSTSAAGPPLSPSPGGMSQTPHLVKQLQVERWVGEAGPCFTAMALAPASSLLALATTSGSVEVHRVGGEGGGTRHLRTLSLSDWGATPQDTGPATHLAWGGGEVGGACGDSSSSESPGCSGSGGGSRRVEGALAVGYGSRGLVVWSLSGCRLLCTLRQATLKGGGTAQLPNRGEVSPLSCEALAGRSSLSSPSSSDMMAAVPPLGGRGEALALGVRGGLAWGVGDYNLMAGDNANPGSILQFSMARVVTQRWVAHGVGAVQLLQGEDRVLVVQPPGDGALSLRHLVLPPDYINANWPVRHVALSPDAQDIAISGRRGVILHHLGTAKWRMFGDISQERTVVCTHLLWLGKLVVICNALNQGAGPYELKFYPRYHLDESSLLLRHPLGGAPPVSLDCQSDYLLCCTSPAPSSGSLHITLHHAHTSGSLSPSPLGPKPTLRLTPLRELSLMTARAHPLAMALVLPRREKSSESGGTTAPAPSRCMVLRGGGKLSLLDLEDASERTVASGVESFWLTMPPHPPGSSTTSSSSSSSSMGGSLVLPTTPTGGQRKAGGEGGGGGCEATVGGDPLEVGTEELPWWVYGHRGMQVWYPSSPAASSSGNPSIVSASTGNDPELEFDREVYPLGVSPATGAIIGLSSRMCCSWSGSGGGGGGGAGTRGGGSSGSLVAGGGTGMGGAAWCSPLPAWDLLPSAQPILPCLLRHLLHKGSLGKALMLARASQGRPHFSQSLEWLLFTSVDALVTSSSRLRKQKSQVASGVDLDPPALNPPPEDAPHSEATVAGGCAREEPGSGAGKEGGGQGRGGGGHKGKNAASGLSSSAAAQYHHQVLVEQVVKLARQFPEFLDVVVSVGRKTDEREWAALFSAVGRPTSLFEECMARGQLRTAANFILVIDRMEGASTSQRQALRLLQAALSSAQYLLAGELVGFLMRSGRQFADVEVPSQEQEAEKSMLQAFLGFGFTSTKPEERANMLHTTVMRILKQHAIELVGATELRLLVAFTRGTQFDLGGFLADEQNGAARLEDFPSTLQTVHEKLAGRGDQVAGRLEAEFLLAHMRAAGCTEWVVVLATLLHRKPILLELFRDDDVLWQAYRRTLKSSVHNNVYQPLLADLDDEMAH